MASFLFFVETDRGALGTADAPSFMELLREPMTRRMATGPNGKPGLLVFEADAPMSRVQVVPAAQVWRAREELPGIGVVYTGMWKDWKPCEEDLRRAVPTVAELGNAWVRVPGGERWLLPALTYGNGSTRLPRAAELGPDGVMVWEPLLSMVDWETRGRRLWETAVATMGLRPADGPVLTASEVLTLVHEGLSVYYRVGRVEINMLQVLPGESFLVVAFAMVGQDALKAALRIMDELPGKAVPLPCG